MHYHIITYIIISECHPLFVDLYPMEGQIIYLSNSLSSLRIWAVILSDQVQALHTYQSTFVCTYVTVRNPIYEMP